MRQAYILLSLCVVALLSYSGRVFLQQQQQVQQPQLEQFQLSSSSVFHLGSLNGNANFRSRALQAADDDILGNVLTCIAEDILDLECLGDALFPETDDGDDDGPFAIFNDFLGCAFEEEFDIECFIDSLVDRLEADDDTTIDDPTNPDTYLVPFNACLVEELEEFQFDLVCFFDALIQGVDESDDETNPMVLLRNVVVCTPEFDIECMFESLQDFLDARSTDDGDDSITARLSNALDCAEKDLFDTECLFAALFPSGDGDDDNLLGSILECELFDFECYIEALQTGGDDDANVLNNVLSCLEGDFDIQCYLAAVLPSGADANAMSLYADDPISKTYNCLFSDTMNVGCYLEGIFGASSSQKSLSVNNELPFEAVGNMFNFCMKGRSVQFECLLQQLFPEDAQGYSIGTGNSLTFDTSTSIGKVLACLDGTGEELDMDCLGDLDDLSQPFSRLNVFTQVTSCYNKQTNSVGINCLTSTDEGTSEWMFEIMVNGKHQLASQVAAAQQLSMFNGIAKCAESLTEFDCFQDLVVQTFDSSDTGSMLNALSACDGGSNNEVNMNCVLNVLLPGSASVTSSSNMQTPLDVVDSLLGCYTGAADSACFLNQVLPDVDLSSCIQGGNSLSMQCGANLVSSSSAAANDEFNGWNVLTQLSECKDGDLLELSCAFTSPDGFSVVLSNVMDNQQARIDAANMASALGNALDVGGLMTGLDGLGVDVDLPAIVADMGDSISFGQVGGGILDNIASGVTGNMAGLNDALEDAMNALHEQAQGLISNIMDLRQKKKWNF